MARALLTALLVLLCLQAPAKAESPPGDRDEPVTIGVMEFVAKGGISQDKADSLLDVLAGEINRLGDARVVTRTDIQSMLDLEKLTHHLRQFLDQAFLATTDPSRYPAGHVYASDVHQLQVHHERSSEPANVTRHHPAHPQSARDLGETLRVTAASQAPELF